MRRSGSTCGQAAHDAWRFPFEVYSKVLQARAERPASASARGWETCSVQRTPAATAVRRKLLLPAVGTTVQSTAVNVGTSKARWRESRRPSQYGAASLAACTCTQCNGACVIHEHAAAARRLGTLTQIEPKPLQQVEVEVATVARTTALPRLRCAMMHIGIVDAALVVRNLHVIVLSSQYDASRHTLGCA